MTDEQLYGEINARIAQAQGDYDRAVRQVEKAVAFHDRIPDGHARRTEANARLQHALNHKNAMEREMMHWVNRLEQFEAEHGPQEAPPQPELPGL